MIKRYSLGRRIVLSVAGMVLFVHLLIFILSFAIYGIADAYWPGLFDYESDLPTGPDLTVFFALGLVALAVSVFFSVRIARRLVQPLNSVAEGIRRVAYGDLDARAPRLDKALGEASALVEDFNDMAEKLQRATRERSLWNAAIAHELRTPVTILRGRLQGLSEGVFAPTPETFSKLLTQVDNLSRLIEDLRLLSLFESSQLRMDCRACNLALEVRTLGEIYEPLLTQAGLRLHLAVDAQPVQADPIRIRQALQALLDNAIKYASPGPIWIRGERVAEHYSLRVEDCGPGLDAAAREQVFQAFWQGGTPTAKLAGGNGLGLSVVRAIAIAHGGEALCAAHGEQGTSFELRLPLAREGEPRC